MATFEGPESVLEMRTSGSLEEKDADGESYPCISHVDDDYQKKRKYVSSQMMSRWRQAALAISYASIFCNIALGLAAIVISIRAKSSATFGFAFEALLDVCSSMVVIWRFCGVAGSTLSPERERKACIAIAVCFILSSVGIFTRTFILLTEQKHVHRLMGIETIAGVSLVVLCIMAWLKFLIAEKLSSDSLQTDALNSLAGAIMALGMMISSLIYLQDDNVWYIDAAVGLCIAFALLVYGVRLLSQLIPGKSEAGLNYSDIG